MYAYVCAYMCVYVHICVYVSCIYIMYKGKTAGLSFLALLKSSMKTLTCMLL